MFTYRRPNEITSTAGESFVAEGPTNEILDVYVSNKSVQMSNQPTRILISSTSISTTFSADDLSAAKPWSSLRVHSPL